MGKHVRNLRNEHQCNIVSMLNSMEGRNSRWQIWQDFITVAAVAISNTVDLSHREERESIYANIAKKYSVQEMRTMSLMFAEIVDGMERNPDQDFLGELFMALELGNEWKGQFFTPYSVCRAMAAISYNGEIETTIRDKGFASVNDPACGAGALLLAFANECRRRNINYQTSVLFVAQDIDFLAGLMCYIQMSLLGCPGYVVIGDSLAHPTTSYDARGLLPRDKEVWFTPMFYRDIWAERRSIEQLKLICMNQFGPIKAPATFSYKENVSEHKAEIQTPPESVATEIITYDETESGQLTFF